MQVGSSSLTRDRTRAPCIGSTESLLLRHQGSPSADYLKVKGLFYFSLEQVLSSILQANYFYFGVLYIGWPIQLNNHNSNL